MATAASKKKITAKQLVKSKKPTPSVKTSVKAKTAVKKPVAKAQVAKTKTKAAVTKTLVKSKTKAVVKAPVKKTAGKATAKPLPKTTAKAVKSLPGKMKNKTNAKAKALAKPAVKIAAKKTAPKTVKPVAKKATAAKAVLKVVKTTAKPAVVKPAGKTAAAQPANNNQQLTVVAAAPKKVKAPARNKKQKAQDKKLARTLVKIANAGRTGLASTGVQSAANAALQATMAMAANMNMAANDSAPVAPTAPAAAANAKLQFSTGEMVVYPAHGVGRVEGVETHTIAGMDVKLFKITFEHDKMTLKVPVQRATGSGLRPLSSKDVMKNAMETLRGRPRIRRVMWSRRAQEYEQKINSGDPVAIAEVLRDLRRNAESGEQSYSERQIFQNALDRLAREVAAVEKIEHEKAIKKLEDVLTKTPAAA